MSARKRTSSARQRIGRVSLFFHHGHWWVYYRHHGQQIRRKVAATRPEAEQIAAQVNAQLTSGAPTLLAFTPVSVPELRRHFLGYHEYVLKSSVATIRRYRAATQHLEDFTGSQSQSLHAHQIQPDAFVAYLRKIEVAPNGHPHAARRQLRDKGIQFILETCRALYTFAGKQRHLPPYAGNPFAALPLDRLKIEDAKSIFVFDAATETAFFRAADAWSFPIHLTLAKTGLRVGEATHLLIEEVDLASGWLHVRNKTTLGWRVKTGTERSIPLLPEVVAVLRRTIGPRTAGPLFLRQRFANGLLPPLVACRGELERVCKVRQLNAGEQRSREESLKIARTVWRDAGAVKPDTVRSSFIRIMRLIGNFEATCPKSWRHSFATLLQDANVDPLVRQLVLGHQPASGGLGMTMHYTHTRPETLYRQIDQALRLWPKSLELAYIFARGAQGA